MPLVEMLLERESKADISAHIYPTLQRHTMIQFLGRGRDILNQPIIERNWGILSCISLQANIWMTTDQLGARNARLRLLWDAMALLLVCLPA